MEIIQMPFGEKAKLYSMENDNGYKLQVTDYGARIVRLIVPTSEGERNIVLGFDSEEEYTEKDPYIGATIGRVAGRIQGGEVQINGELYQLKTQPDGNTLHGGPESFEINHWDVELVTEQNQVQVIFSLTSFDGDNGFPGEVSVMVIYSLTNTNEWKLEYRATTDQPTVFNPTNHVYFNLTGDPEQSVGEHTLMVQADRYALVAEDTTTTGEIRSVTHTPFDFRQPALLDQVFNDPTNDPQIQLVNGLDHPLLFADAYEGPTAELTAPDKKVKLTMATTEPAMVLFTAQFGEQAPIVRGKKLAQHGGLTFETQVPPGATRYADFGSILLRPEDYYTSATTFLIETDHQRYIQAD